MNIFLLFSSNVLFKIFFFLYLRYNPGDYVQDSSDLMSNESPSLSDDSSYFSDVCEQSTCIRTPKHHTSFRDSKVQLYDHTTRQRNNYNRPLDVVERLDIRNEVCTL